jgi:hypothetical protein
MPEGKVITTLRFRREIEGALRALAKARTVEEGVPHLRVLANYGAAALPVLLRYLDTPDPWMVRALGRVVAQMEDRARAGAAMRRAILAPDSSDRRRIVAMVLLDQFLGQSLDDSLFSALGNPTEVALGALLKDTGEMEPLVRLDYLSIIHAQSPIEVLYALDRFREEGGTHVIEALRFFALDEREMVARSAVEGLASIRQPDSLRALISLISSVPSYRRPLVERTRRKLELMGVSDAPRPQLPSGSRVLVSPLDGAGNRLVLFLFPEAEVYQVLHVFLDHEQGIRGAYEVEQPSGELPPEAEPGSVHPAPHPWQGIFLLESGFAYARQLLRKALDRNEARGANCPLEYRFFLDQIWGWAIPEQEPPVLPSAHVQPSQDLVADLIGHPYLASWFLESDAIYEAATGLLRVDLSRQDGQSLLSLATVSLVQKEFSAEVCVQYASRLRDTAAWLVRAGEDKLVSVSLGAIEALEVARPLRSAFALMLVQKSLLFALGNLHREIELQAESGSREEQ